MRALLLPVLLGFLPLVGGCHDQAAGGAGPRAQIRVVGSSTVYPFTTIVAEQLVATRPDAAAPVIESTGTGAGFRLFCAGIGPEHPDITDASRRMRRAEYRRCVAAGVDRVIEVPVGLDGVVLAKAQGGLNLSLNAADLYRALAAAPLGRPNVTRTWADVDARLPAIPIQVYGPPATSGTRDALVGLILARGCEAVDPAARALPPSAYEARCTKLREDGAFIDAGENDNMTVRKLQLNRQAIGVFGYSYLEENADSVRGIPLDGVLPSYPAIASGRYPGARPLYLYVKQAHLDAVPDLRTFLSLYVLAAAPGGPLTRRGLIAAPPAARARAARAIAHDLPLNPASLS